MNTVSEHSLPHPVIQIPGSKSYTSRALLLAALTKGVVSVVNPLWSEDTEAMVKCLQRLNLMITCSIEKIVVSNDIFNLPVCNTELFVRDSGTTFRSLLALACLIPGTQIIYGNTRLNERPIAPLVNALRQLGAKIDYLERENQAPLQITSSYLYGGKVAIPADISSQFFSVLLMIAPLIGDITIEAVGELISTPYIDMTLAMMGQPIITHNKKFYCISKSAYQTKSYYIEGDYSSASYFFALSALTGDSYVLKNLLAFSLQADVEFLKILIEMGNHVEYSDDGLIVKGGHVQAGDFNMQNCPDQIPTMAVLMAFAKGISTITGIKSLRVKESDRVQAIQNELAKMHIQTKASENTLIIYGGKPIPAQIETYNDHRIAMSFAIAYARLPEMQILNPEVVNKTFPTFWEALRECISL